jgi:antitoxin component of MazEF toxin-antitoxin module
MKRKLIKQGGSGLVAYIPKKWVDEKKLKAGDEIDFIEEADDLIISAKPKEDKKEIDLDFREEDPLFIKIIINDLYRSGFDRMIISYKTEEQFETVNETVNEYLLGFEITEKRDGKVIIENITLPEEEKQEVLLRRIFFILEDMFDIIGQKIESKKVNDKQITEDKRKIGQYDNFSRRNISKKKFYQESSSFYWMLYYHLYLISHNLYHLYGVLQENSRYKASKKILYNFSEIKKFYLEMQKGFFTKDLSKLKKINTAMNKFLYSPLQKDMQLSKNAEGLVLYYLAELIRLLYKTNTPVLGILLSSQTQTYKNQ